jgi:hypothetical protein
MNRRERELRFFLRKHMSEEAIEAWLNCPLSVFGGVSAYEFVEELIRIGNAESYEDAWREVLGTARRIYG